MFRKTVRLVIWIVCGYLFASLQASGSEPKKIQEWIEQLRHPNPGVRVQAAAKLAEIGSLGVNAELALERLAKCMQDADANVRLYAGFALGRIEAEPERSVTLLTPLLADSDEHVRYSAEWSIAVIARSVSNRELSEEDARRLFRVFETVEGQMLRGAFQERHLLAVKLARTRLESRELKPIDSAIRPEPILPKVEPKRDLPPVVSQPTIPTQNLSVSLALYRTNDVAGRLQIVDRMTDGPDFDDALRLAVLEVELESTESNVAFYAVKRWKAVGQRLISSLFDSISEAELEKPVSLSIVRLLTPSQPLQIESLCKWVASIENSIEIRIACLESIQRAGNDPDVAKATKESVVRMLDALVFDSNESNAIRIAGIEVLAACDKNSQRVLPILLRLFTEPELPPDIRSAAASGLSKLAPNSVDAATAIVTFMRRLAVEEALFSELASTLGDFGPTGSVGIDRLLEGLRAQELETRVRSAESIEKIGPLAARAVPALVARITDPMESIAVKGPSSLALKHMGRVAIDLLIEQLQHPEGIVREHVIRALTTAAGSDPIVKEPCLASLTDSYEKGPVRAAAAAALGGLGPNAHQAIPALLRACDVTQPAELRAASIIAMARIDPQQASPTIQANLDDSELVVRASAAFALHLCGDTKTSVDSLLMCIDGSDSDAFVHEVLLDLGPAAIPFLMPIAESRQRSTSERLHSVQTAIAIQPAPWTAIVRLIEDDEIGDQVAILVSSHDIFDSEIAPLLMGLMREGRMGSATRNRIVGILEADGFGGGGDEDKWPNTLAVNQPGAGQSARTNEAHEFEREMSSISSAAVSAMPPESPVADFFPPTDKRRIPNAKSDPAEDRKVSVFYGTNRAPVLPNAPKVPISVVHIVLASIALVAMSGCFFLFPRHSNVRYAIASLVGMGAVSTVAMQAMLITDGRIASGEMLRYGGQYSDQVEYGVCEVSIPPVHQPGELESPQLFKLDVTEDIERHVVLTHVGRMDANAFHAAMKTEMDRRGKNIFVFIHGYNVSFEDAARRTGQMAYDLKFPGAPVFYSWPSQANWYSYVNDKENIDISTDQIRTFLLDIATRSNADTINLIAHSMGNVGLTAALSEIEQGSKPHFNQVVLAAPDIDAAVFKEQIASKIVTKAKHTTLYTSKTDLALLASRYFHQGSRAGDSGPEVLVMDGIDTIDATAVDSSLLGHSYYGSNVTVLDDLGQLLQNQPVESRHYLRSIVTPTRPYWAFEPLKISRVASPPSGQRR